MATEVEHTLRSTFLHVYAYFNVTWLIFVLKVAVMSLNGCGNFNYWSSLLIDRNMNRNKYMNLLGYINIFVTANSHIHTHTHTHTDTHTHTPTHRHVYTHTVVVFRSI